MIPSENVETEKFEVREPVELEVDARENLNLEIAKIEVLLCR